MGIEIAYFAGAVILGAAIAYGMYQSSRKKPANRAVTAEATKEIYKEPEGYTDRKRERFESKIER